MIDARTTKIAACVVAACAMLLSAAAATATDSVLVRLAKRPEADRNTLLNDGVPLVAETNDSWLAAGDPGAIAEAAASLALTVEPIVEIERGDVFALVGTMGELDAEALAPCGRQIASGDHWRLVVAKGALSVECVESPLWFVTPLDLEPLAPERHPPSRWEGLADQSEAIIPDPLVQTMVDTIDSNVALSHWQALSESPSWTTRYSRAQGCIDAAAYVHDLFATLGLDAEYQHHTSGHADNVIGTLTGAVDPDQVYIAIAHLDDLPSSGPAPGADDNASGSAMVTAAAEAMAGYCFEHTVKFLAVTGEEQGLYGSDHYADSAAASGEAIQAVLNGDMIGWEGDTPASEDLDIIYNSTSAWLSQMMVDAAAAYATGMTINELDCPSMTYSDHSPFWQNGYSAIVGITDDQGLCGSGGSYPHYHLSSDTIANCGPTAPDFEAAAIRTYVATLAHLAVPIAPVPSTPVGVVAAADGDNRIALSWSPQDPGTLVRIDRATGTCADPGPFSPVGSTAGTSFVDTAVSGGVPYAYTIAAVTAGSCSSPSSLCVDAVTTGPCTEPPVFAGVASVTTPGETNCRLDVDWQPPATVWCGGPVRYNVYRSTDPAFTPSAANLVAADVAATVWSDADVVYGEQYHYVVRAVDLAAGTEDTNLVRLAGSPTGPPEIGTWTDDAGDTGTAKLTPTPPWAVVAGAGASGAGYSTGHYPSSTCAAVTTPPLLLGAAPGLSFWSQYRIEDGWDKGELQISTDDGASWARLPMTYPGSSSHTNDACGLGTGAFFTGYQSSFTQFSADLGAWAGQSIRIRWLFSSDSYLEDDGWTIDDIAVTNAEVPGFCSGSAMIFADGFESGDTGAWSP